MDDMTTIPAAAGYYVIDWIEPDGLEVSAPVIAWLVQTNYTRNHSNPRVFDTYGYVDAVTPSGTRSLFDKFAPVGYQLPDGRVWLCGHNMPGHLGWDGYVLLPDLAA